MRRVALLAAALMIFTGLAAAPSAATPAGSVTLFSGSDCPADSLCLYRHRGFTGGGVAIGPDTYVERLADHGFDDRMSSWSNDSGQICDWWTEYGRGGTIHDLRDGRRADLPRAENDTASSVECW
ncbi:hypothetical protein GCM10010232_12060 [Streptomyces amakusaensis]|uniref:Peptidase inhibitor family I36 protein n=1 Tax=Streptomyces amakusaensis TaxID=67271 RepID=A0ABW0ABB0_9ACTN